MGIYFLDIQYISGLKNIRSGSDKLVCMLGTVSCYIDVFKFCYKLFTVIYVLQVYYDIIFYLGKSEIF